MREFIILFVVCAIYHANAQMGIGGALMGMGMGMGTRGGPGGMALAMGAGGALDLKNLIRTRMLMNMISKTGKGSFFQNMLHVRTFCEMGDSVMGEGLHGIYTADCWKMMGMKCIARSTEKYGLPNILTCQKNGLCCFNGLREKVVASRLAAKKK